MGKVRVVLVEDQLLILNSLKMILNMKDDIEIVGTALNGQEAILIAEETKPELVLMDIHMPVMNGIQATRILKEKTPDLKIIMLTTLQTRDSALSALNAGAEGYILKAIDPDDLAAAIRLVSRGETMISQEVARMLFSQPLPEPAIEKETSELDTLTQREIEVLKCISQGMTNSNIAEKLFLSEGTVRNYISTIYSKLNVSNRIQAIKKGRNI